MLHNPFSTFLLFLHKDCQDRQKSYGQETDHIFHYLSGRKRNEKGENTHGNNSRLSPSDQWEWKERGQCVCVQVSFFLTFNSLLLRPLHWLLFFSSHSHSSQYNTNGWTFRIWIERKTFPREEENSFANTQLRISPFCKNDVHVSLSPSPWEDWTV